MTETLGATAIMWTGEPKSAKPYPHKGQMRWPTFLATGHVVHFPALGLRRVYQHLPTMTYRVKIKGRYKRFHLTTLQAEL